MSNKLYDVIAKVMKVPVSRINNESSPENIETWDSFHGLVLLDEIETAFNAKFTLDEVINIKTVGDIERILQYNHAALSD